MWNQTEMGVGGFGLCKIRFDFFPSYVHFSLLEKEQLAGPPWKCNIAIIYACRPPSMLHCNHLATLPPMLYCYHVGTPPPRDFLIYGRPPTAQSTCLSVLYRCVTGAMCDCVHTEQNLMFPDNF